MSDTMCKDCHLPLTFKHATVFSCRYALMQKVEQLEKKVEGLEKRLQAAVGVREMRQTR